MLATKSGFEWVHVPYKGSPPLLQDLIAGRVDAAFTGFSNVLPHHSSGKVRIIAVGAGSRIKSVPNVPTFKELGLQEIGAEYIIMLSAPAGTPREVVNLLASTANAVLQEKDIQEKNLEPLGLEPIGSTAAEAASYIAADRPVQRERIKISGARLD
jgi:tripartite-type tricarboxylate transporter receptor subunit TctC